MEKPTLQDLFNKVVKGEDNASLGVRSDRGNGSLPSDPPSNSLLELEKPTTTLTLEFGQGSSTNLPVGKNDVPVLEFSRRKTVKVNTEKDEEGNRFLAYSKAPSFEADVCGFIELYYTEHGEIPEYRTLHDQFADYPERPKYIKNWSKILDGLENKLELRGLPAYRTAENYLDPQFITACNVILNIRDSRTDSAKLKDMGISPQKWDRWLKKKAYFDHFKKLSERIFDSEIQVSAKRTVAKLVEQGDLSAVKYLNEWQGTYRPQDNAVQMMQVFMNAILAILARNVTSDIISTIQAELREDPGIKQTLGFIEAEAS